MNIFELGVEHGREEGETLFSTLIQHLIADNRTKDIKLAAEEL